MRRKIPPTGTRRSPRHLAATAAKESKSAPPEVFAEFNKMLTACESKLNTLTKMVNVLTGKVENLTDQVKKLKN